MALSDKDQRTLRYAAAGIALYLLFFFGWSQWKKAGGQRAEYEKLEAEARGLRAELQPYENKVLLMEKLREEFKLKPPALSRATLVAEASAAIQKAAQGGGIQLGPTRESPGRGAAKELSTIQLEGTGQAPAVMGLLHRLTTLGYPLVIDSVQINVEPMKPGMVKAHLTIVILDFEQWKKEEPRA